LGARQVLNPPGQTEAVSGPSRANLNLTTAILRPEGGARQPFRHWEASPHDRPPEATRSRRGSRDGDGSSGGHRATIGQFRSTVAPIALTTAWKTSFFVTVEPHDPIQMIVTETTINYRHDTWYRTSREGSAKIAHFTIIDPLVGSAGMRFKLLGVEPVDGRQAYHWRSRYAY
jgi:hypothetical protein